MFLTRGEIKEIEKKKQFEKDEVERFKQKYDDPNYYSDEDIELKIKRKEEKAKYYAERASDASSSDVSLETESDQSLIDDIEGE